MNEVMIVFGTGGYIYYKTDENNVECAVEEAINCMENNGINTNNLEPTEAVLRDGDYNDIDSITYR